jgi:hypothetical protein
MKTALLLILFGTTAAQAQVPYCDEINARAVGPFNTICALRDQPTVYDFMSKGGATISASPEPKCDDGYELVMSRSMRPLCARDLKEPH